MSAGFALPSLPALSSPPHLERPKRRLSNAASVAAFDLSDQEDEDEYNKPRSKRSRVGAGMRAGSPSLFEGEAGGSTAGGSSQGGGAGGAGGVKALSEKEKESRRQARMIRNRSEYHFTLPREIVH